MVSAKDTNDRESVVTVVAATIIVSALILAGVTYSRSTSQERAAAIDALMAERRAVSLDIDEIAAAFTDGRNSLEAAVIQLEQRLAQTSLKLQPGLTERAFLATVLVRKTLAQLEDDPERAEAFLCQSAKEYESLCGEPVSVDVLCAGPAEKDTEAATKSLYRKWLGQVRGQRQRARGFRNRA